MTLPSVHPQTDEMWRPIFSSWWWLPHTGSGIGAHDEHHGFHADAFRVAPFVWRFSVTEWWGCRPKVAATGWRFFRRRTFAAAEREICNREAA